MALRHTNLGCLAARREAGDFREEARISQSAILRGSFSCDFSAYTAIHSHRLESGKPLPRRLIFVGRFVETKCIDELVKAYFIYRTRVYDPWPLICCGGGTLKWRLENEEGVRLDGFIQPDDMPRALSSAGCLILPFRPMGLSDS